MSTTNRMLRTEPKSSFRIPVLPQDLGVSRGQSARAFLHPCLLLLAQCHARGHTFTTVRGRDLGKPHKECLKLPREEPFTTPRPPVEFALTKRRIRFLGHFIPNSSHVRNFLHGDIHLPDKHFQTVPLEAPRKTQPHDPD